MSMFQKRSTSYSWATTKCK